MLDSILDFLLTHIWTGVCLLIPLIFLYVSVFLVSNSAVPCAPNHGNYDYIIVGASLAGCAAARRLRDRHPSASILLIDAKLKDELNRVVGGGVFSITSDSIIADMITKLPDLSAWIGRFPGFRAFAIATETDRLLQHLVPSLDTMFAKDSAQKMEMDRSTSPLTWAFHSAGDHTVVETQAPRRARGLPNPLGEVLPPRYWTLGVLRWSRQEEKSRIELRDGVAAVRLGSEMKSVHIVVAGKAARSTSLEIRANKALIMAVGARAFAKLCPDFATAKEAADSKLIPFSFQVKAKLRASPLNIGSVDTVLPIVNDNREHLDALLRFVPDCPLTIGEHCMEHIASMVIGVRDCGDRARIAHYYETIVKQLARRAPLTHLLTGRIVIDPSLLLSVPPQAAHAILYSQSRLTKRRFGKVTDELTKKIIDECGTADYVQRYIEAHALDAGERCGTSPLGVCVSADDGDFGRIVIDTSGRSYPDSIVYVADATLVGPGVHLLYGMYPLSMVISLRVVQTL